MLFDELLGKNLGMMVDILLVVHILALVRFACFASSSHNIVTYNRAPHIEMSAQYDHFQRVRAALLIISMVVCCACA